MSFPPIAPSARPASRARRMAPLAGVALAAALVLGACLGPDGQRSLGLVNQERVNRGIHILDEHGDLNAKAQGWAEHLAARGALAHSDLRQGTPPNVWLAENVGVGSSIDEVHHTFMRSAVHRDNLLNGRYTHAGVGVARSGDGRWWVVHVYMG